MICIHESYAFSITLLGFNSAFSYTLPADLFNVMSYCLTVRIQSLGLGPNLIGMIRYEMVNGKKVTHLHQHGRVKNITLMCLFP